LRPLIQICIGCAATVHSPARAPTLPLSAGGCCALRPALARSPAAAPTSALAQRKVPLRASALLFACAPALALAQAIAPEHEVFCNGHLNDTAFKRMPLDRHALTVMLYMMHADEAETLDESQECPLGDNKAVTQCHFALLSCARVRLASLSDVQGGVLMQAHYRQHCVSHPWRPRSRAGLRRRRRCRPQRRPWPLAAQERTPLDTARPARPLPRPPRTQGRR